MLRHVDRVTGLRMLRRMMPRRWKRYFALTVLVAMVLRPDLVPQTASWLWEQRTQQMISVVTDTATHLSDRDSP